MDEQDNPIEYKPKNTASNNSIIEMVKAYLANEAFTHKKITDTPTDANQVVPRKYVNLNGTSANRPTSSIAGQFYYDTTISRPLWFDPTTGRWIDAAGSIR